MKSTLEKLTFRNARWLSVNRVRSTAESSAVLRRIHQPPVIMLLLQSRRLLILALMVSQRLGRQATTCFNQISIDTQLPSKILVAALQVPSALVNQEISGWSRITQVKEDILLRQIPDHHSAHLELSLLIVTLILMETVALGWQRLSKGKNRLRSCWKPLN